ncbi:MAG: DUF1223 domain-containing protein [Alphaproteobacteria bacterium]|nr:DUF1223 domain-containing protein [Alphaproteobacteria bacterium]|tara:strand:+ start:6000 stop:6746 length:747 start_codon:yes stop_codon:yes gene_type:complete
MGWIMNASRSIGIVVALLLGAASAMAGDRSPTVVELYTSQGCSSCPPADRHLGELAKREDIIALSFHVDYWDYIGWKDTFALPESTARQRRHGRALNARYVYTPEMVIDGIVDVVGSQSHEVEKTLVEARLSTLNNLSVSLTESGQDSATIRIGAKAEWPEADVWLIEFDKQHTVKVRREENSRRELTYFNVVRNIRKGGTWKGDLTEIPVDLSAIREGGRDGCVVIVQKVHGGPVFGAARLQLASAD